MSFPCRLHQGIQGFKLLVHEIGKQDLREDKEARAQSCAVQNVGRALPVKPFPKVFAWQRFSAVRTQHCRTHSPSVFFGA